MRLLIVSDLHANASALERVVEHADAVAVLGDLVDYGPDPEATIAWVRRNATYAVRGNHDEAVASGAPTGASERLVDVAEESATWTRARLGDADRHFLGSLPLCAEFSFAGTTFAAVHAAPSDPLRPYLRPDTPDERWQSELASVQAEWLLVGHTHLPFMRRFGSQTVLNPGSVGQPRDGIPLASYMIWEDGDVFLIRRRYAVDDVVRRLRDVDFSAAGRERLSSLLQTGSR
ncbi:MAG TPA: metallophosphoesterase family protein [Candidatus Limnocylindrales bacterium]